MTTSSSAVQWWAQATQPGTDAALMLGMIYTIITEGLYDKEEFQRTKDEYYQLRQWDVATGLQTRAKLVELGLTDVAQSLEQRGLTVQA